MLSPAIQREESERFCRDNIVALCNEILVWVYHGTLGGAPKFRALSDQCGLWGGLEYGRKIAENMVRTQAMLAVVRGGKD